METVTGRGNGDNMKSKSDFVRYNMNEYIGEMETWNVLKGKMEKSIPFCYVRFNEGESRLVANINGTPRGRGSTMEPEEVRQLGECSINKVGKRGGRPYGQWNYNQQEDKEFHNLMLESLVEEHPDYHASLCNIRTFSNYRYQTLIQMDDKMTSPPSQVLSAHMPHDKNVHNDFLETIKQYSGKVNLVINETGKTDNFPFKCNNIWTVSNHDAHRNSMGVIDDIKKEIEQQNIQNELFLGCAGPFTNVVLHQLWKSSPTNYYIDAGSTLDGFLFDHVARGWLEKIGYSHYLRPKLRGKK